MTVVQSVVMLESILASEVTEVVLIPSLKSFQHMYSLFRSRELNIREAMPLQVIHEAKVMDCKRQYRTVQYRTAQHKCVTVSSTRAEVLQYMSDLM